MPLFGLAPTEWQAVQLSLLVAFWASLLSLPLAVLVAYALALAILGRQLLNICVHLPLILPPVVTGYVLLLVFGQTAPVGRFLNDTFGIVWRFVERALCLWLRSWRFRLWCARFVWRSRQWIPN